MKAHAPSTILHMLQQTTEWAVAYVRVHMLGKSASHVCTQFTPLRPYVTYDSYSL
mgnify:CR=1 FL=1